MAEITAQQVKELREKTGAGMMDCKRALTENAGDITKAIEWLRQKGITSAEKKASRVAAEGMIGSYIHTGSRIGVLVEVNCETDFVARREEFKKLVNDVAIDNIKEKIVAGRIEKRLKELSLLDQPFIRDQNISIDELLKQAIAALGENIQVRRFQRFVLGEGIEKEETDFAAEVAAQMGQKAPEPVAAAPQVEEKAPEPAAKDNPPAKGKKKK